MKKLRFLSFFIVISIIIIISGCSKQTEKAIDSNVLDKIQIKVLNISKLNTGNGYSLKLINSSPYLIKQNSVYISYPIKSDTGSAWNKCKVEATGNKLNIKPNEEVLLNVFIQKEVYDSNKYLDIDNPQIEFICYINDVSEMNRFNKMGSFELFDKGK